MLKVGEEIEVKILEVSSSERKLSLGIKQLSSNPWDEAESKFSVGQKVPSIVNKIINDHNGKIEFIPIDDGAKIRIDFIK